MAVNCQKRLEAAVNGWNGCKLLEMAKMAGYGWKWLEMAGTGWIWLEQLEMA